MVERWDLAALCHGQGKTPELHREQERPLNKRRRNPLPPQMHLGIDHVSFPQASYQNANTSYSLLAGLNATEEPENPASPPSVAASPALPKADLANSKTSADKKESDS